MAPIVRYSNIVLLGLIVACSSYKGLENLPPLPESDGRVAHVDRMTIGGVVVRETTEQIYSDTELDMMNQQTIKAAEAEAEAEQALFRIRTKQGREKTKQATAQYMSWVCFGSAILAIALGAFTHGYLRWGITGGILFVTGMLFVIMPELSDYLKWFVIGLCGIGIVRALYHAREFSLGRLLTTTRTIKESNDVE